MRAPLLNHVAQGLLVSGLLLCWAVANLARAQPAGVPAAVQLEVPAPRGAVVSPRGAVPAIPPGAITLMDRTAWNTLTPLQKQALQPLQSTWVNISDAQKRKWLAISKNYEQLSPEDRQTMHSRMSEWVSMTPQLRAEARLNFANTKELAKKLTPEEKISKWESYQALSAEEKQKLAATATPKPIGAAIAVKPVARQKLAEIPLHEKALANRAERQQKKQAAAPSPALPTVSVPAQ